MTDPTDSSGAGTQSTGPAAEAGSRSLARLLETYQAWSGRNLFVTAERRALAAGDVERASALRGIRDQEPVVPPLDALAAQHELSTLLAGWEWQTVRDAREAGASWSEIARATRADPAQARAAYVQAVARQEQAAVRGGLPFDDAAGYHSAARRWTDELHSSTPDEVLDAIEDAIACDDVDQLDELRVTWWNPDHRPASAGMDNMHEPSASPEDVDDETAVDGDAGRHDADEQAGGVDGAAPAGQIEMPQWMRDHAARTEAEITAGRAVPCRPDDPDVLSARIAALRAPTASGVDVAGDEQDRRDQLHRWHTYDTTEGITHALTDGPVDQAETDTDTDGDYPRWPR